MSGRVPDPLTSDGGTRSGECSTHEAQGELTHGRVMVRSRARELLDVERDEASVMTATSGGGVGRYLAASTKILQVFGGLSFSALADGRTFEPGRILG